MADSVVEIAGRFLVLAARAVLFIWEQVFAELLFYWTARLLIPVLTIGLARVAPSGHPQTEFNRFGVAKPHGRSF